MLFSEWRAIRSKFFFQFEWFKNGQPLREGNRFTTKYDILSKVLTLQILAARPDDEGTYTVRASNPSGADETSCKLTIKPTVGIDTRPFVQPENFDKLELKAPPPTKEDLAKPEAPKVVIPLEDTQLKEGAPALLSAKIIGRPTPDVRCAMRLILFSLFSLLVCLAEG